jgi:hypothetical protein
VYGEINEHFHNLFFMWLMSVTVFKFKIFILLVKRGYWCNKAPWSCQLTCVVIVSLEIACYVFRAQRKHFIPALLLGRCSDSIWQLYSWCAQFWILARPVAIMLSLQANVRTVPHLGNNHLPPNPLHLPFMGHAIIWHKMVLILKALLCRPLYCDCLRLRVPANFAQGIQQPHAAYCSSCWPILVQWWFTLRSMRREMHAKLYL